MPLHRWLAWLTFAAVISGCASAPYGAPPETSDPWQLIHSARDWLQKGRPRAAMPSLEKALVEVERLDPQQPGYAHAKAAIYNELGRVYEMTSALEQAEAHFRQAAQIASSVPVFRPLHFDISYNLSTVYERMARLSDSCAQLQRASALRADMLARPAAPPEGYGAAGERFLREVAAPRIEARARRIGCDIGAPGS